MSDFHEIVKAIKQAGMEAVENSKPSTLFFGTVKAVDPLEIFIDQKTILEEDEIILSRNVTDFQTEVSFDNPEIANQIQLGTHPKAPDGTLITLPDTNQESSTKVIFKGNFYFKEKVKHEITVYNALKVGEKVVLIRMQGGQRFLVVDRVGGGNSASKKQ